MFFILNKEKKNAVNKLNPKHIAVCSTVTKQRLREGICPGLYNEDPRSAEDTPCGGGVEYLHRSPESHRRQRKGNTMSAGITGPPCSWGDLNTGTWSCRLGESRIWDSKISWVPRDWNLRIIALARTSSDCKRQTHPLFQQVVTNGVWLQVFNWKKNCWPWVSWGLEPRRNNWR
jgi:hypothetical protein